MVGDLEVWEVVYIEGCLCTRDVVGEDGVGWGEEGDVVEWVG